jgi:CheY-like chemotaxis protein
VANEPFDVMVSDIGLPDATGYDLMKEIKARYTTKGIAMSGYGMDEDLRKSREAGFSDHIIKPANVAQLERTIRRVMNRESSAFSINPS